MEINRDWANWFTGLVDGEGCFLIGRSKGTWRARFVISLRDDDLSILLEIQEVLGMGGIYRHTPKSGRGGYQSKPVAIWTVSCQLDVGRLVALFDKYQPKSKKRLDYQIWRDAVLELKLPAKVRNNARLHYLHDKLKLVRQYDPPEIDDFEPDGIQLEFWKGEADEQV